MNLNLNFYKKQSLCKRLGQSETCTGHALELHVFFFFFHTKRDTQVCCPLIGQKRKSFLAPINGFWSEIEYQFWPFWSEIGYGFCTPVFMNWVCFLEEATSSSFGDRHFPLFFVYANRVRAITACHALRLSAEYQSFSSEIGYQILDQV